jgi:hypothetical protein
MGSYLKTAIDVPRICRPSSMPPNGFGRWYGCNSLFLHFLDTAQFQDATTMSVSQSTCDNGCPEGILHAHGFASRRASRSRDRAPLPWPSSRRPSRQSCHCPATCSQSEHPVPPACAGTPLTIRRCRPTRSPSGRCSRHLLAARALGDASPTYAWPRDWRLLLALARGALAACARRSR